MGSLFETQETSFKNIMEKPLIKLDQRIVLKKKKKRVIESKYANFIFRFDLQQNEL